MLSKKQIMVVFISSLFMSSVYAVEPQGDVPGKSFWSGWFGAGSKQVQREESRVSKTEEKHRSRSERLFSELERSDIRRFYQRNDEDERSEHGKKGKNKNKNKNKQKNKNLPYGLQKKLARGGQLPPGWQDKVSRGEVLSTEILQQSVRLPSDLTRRLPELEDGVVIRRVGDKVVRVLEGNGTVLDVIDLADIILR